MCCQVLIQQQQRQLEFQPWLPIEHRPDCSQDLVRPVVAPERAICECPQEPQLRSGLRLTCKSLQERVCRLVLTQQETAVGELIGVLIDIRLD